jgi:CheY-like chemotaxis protein
MPVADVLIAEPDPDLVSLLTTTYKSVGYDVRTASDGAEALERVLVAPPKLVVADLRLQRIDGAALCETLRRDPSTRTLPLILISDALLHRDFTPAPSVYDALFLKPVEIEALLRESSRLMTRAGDAIHRAEHLRETLGASIGDAHVLGERAKQISEATRTEILRAQRVIRRSTVITTIPPTAPPSMRCPICDGVLDYRKSYFGGVKSTRERWDAYECPIGHGAFEYRHRTGRVRRVV